MLTKTVDPLYVREACYQIIGKLLELTMRPPHPRPVY